GGRDRTHRPSRVDSLPLFFASGPGSVLRMHSGALGRALFRRAVKWMTGKPWQSVDGHFPAGDGRHGGTFVPHFLPSHSGDVHRRTHMLRTSPLRRTAALLATAALPAAALAAPALAATPTDPDAYWPVPEDRIGV